jgi:putative transposase
MSTKPSVGRVRATYGFIRAHQAPSACRRMCRVLGVAPSGYYAWLAHPVSNRAQEDARLVRLIKASFTASQGIDGAPRVFLDLREAGETCSKHRVARLIRENHLRALHGYRVRRWTVGKPPVLIPNRLQRQFTVTRRNKTWVTDITYIRTWQGWLYLAVRGTLIHSDQGPPFGCGAWRRFCRSNRLEPSMSRKGNCWDNAVAESFFSSLKKERIKKQIYKTRDLALNDVADYIDRFYNPTRRHRHPGGVSPDRFEAAHNCPGRVSTESWDLQAQINADQPFRQDADDTQICPRSTRLGHQEPLCGRELTTLGRLKQSPLFSSGRSRTRVA